MSNLLNKLTYSIFPGGILKINTYFREFRSYLKIFKFNGFVQ